MWRMVESYDLRAYYQRVAAVERESGRPVIDRRLFLAVWFYDTLQRVIRVCMQTTTIEELRRW